MALVEQELRRFLEQSSFAKHGGIVTDLDGTALHEDQGRIYIPKSVELGFRELHHLGRPFVLNSLRFPLSVLRTFGKDWYGVSNSPIPAVTLNGSLLGYVAKNEQDELAFEEIAAFPLAAQDIDRILNGVEELANGGMKEVLLFYYPRDWRMGEIIWTPTAEKVLEVKARYVSASAVTAVESAKLRDQLHAEEICMIFLHIDAADEELMAYQHTRRINFFTANDVDKLSGARKISEYLGFDLAASIGAGDSEMDRFLSGVGLAILVGGFSLPFRGSLETIRVKNSIELGELLFDVAALVRETQ